MDLAFQVARYTNSRNNAKGYTLIRDLSYFWLIKIINNTPPLVIGVFGLKYSVSFYGLLVDSRNTYKEALILFGNKTFSNTHINDRSFCKNNS